MSFKTSMILPALILAFGIAPDRVEAKMTDPKICRSVVGTDLVFPKQKKFRILQYDAKTHTYEIDSPEFPGEDSSHVVFEVLMDSVKELGRRRHEILKKPDDLVDGVYVADKDILTLLPHELEKRNGCGPKKK